MALSEKRKEYLRKWRKKNRTKINAKGRVWARNNRKNNPRSVKKQDIKRRLSSHQKAMNKVQWGVESGKLIKPKHCECCGSLRKLQGHHKDYSKPLDVTWLCAPCHGFLHSYIDDCQQAIERSEK